jgi:hypothetical protein
MTQYALSSKIEPCPTMANYSSDLLLAMEQLLGRCAVRS